MPLTAIARRVKCEAANATLRLRLVLDGLGEGLRAARNRRSELLYERKGFGLEEAQLEGSFEPLRQAAVKLRGTCILFQGCRQLKALCLPRRHD